MELILSLLLNTDKNHIVCLDIGCGDGIIIRKLLENNYKLEDKFKMIIGLDIAKSKLKRFKNNCHSNKVEYIIGDARKLCFKNNSVDIVLLFEVIEHFYKQDGVKILHEIYNILKTPDGFLILSTPSYHSPREKLARKSGNLGEHLHIYKFEELKEMLEKIGFRIEHFTTSGFMLPTGKFSWKTTEILLKIHPKILIFLERVIDRLSFLKEINWTMFIIARRV